MKIKNQLFIIIALIPATIFANDSFLWLEDIDSEKSMQWVKQQNATTDKRLKNNPIYDELYKQALSVLNNKSRVPSVSQKGKWLYNFWQDEKHPRGIYRRTKLKNLKSVMTKWETILDMDKYSTKHGKNYDFHGMICASDKQTKCLAKLSPGGSDAVEIKEFNIKTKSFVRDGVFIPLGKTSVSWKNKKTLFVATDFGNDSMSSSGYPRIIKEWKINTPLNQAKIIYKADSNSMTASVYRIKGKKNNLDIIRETTSFWTSDNYQYKDGEVIPLNIPDTANIIGLYQNKLILSLKKDWQMNNQDFIQGEVVMTDISLLQGKEGEIESVVKPNTQSVIDQVDITEKGLLITILEDVKSKLLQYTWQKNKKWKIEEIPFPNNGALKVISLNKKTGDFFVRYESFITPPSLYFVKSKKMIPILIKQQDESFDGQKFKVEQYFTQSLDGTKIPYFVVMSKETIFDGKNPTHIFSYGGFRNTLSPSYSGSYEALSGAYGKLWLERGGVFVLANIRGGGEYGPAWHAAALLKNRHKSFEDFESVARDLFKRKITSAQHLGIEGRSNGGLLVTATMTRHPELYSAIICGAPLIDMQRYNKLLAGASWMGEYGNPDEPDMWNYIKTYSPYQNLQRNKKYPPILFYTSTRDDRVHPGHARKMAAKMLAFKNTVEYYENIEGGHHGFSTNEQLAHRLALSYTHLWSNLK